MAERWIRWLGEVGREDVGAVGAKLAWLGELRRALGDDAERVPDGYALTTQACTRILEAGGLQDAVRQALAEYADGGTEQRARCAERLRTLLGEAALPAEVEAELRAAYRQLESEQGAGCAVVVRPSAAAPAAPDEFFSGLHDAVLDVRGEAMLLDAVRLCLASLHSERALEARARAGVDQLAVGFAIAVQRMVRSDRGAGGRLFTCDPRFGVRSMALVQGAYGLGGSVADGSVNPDEWYVFKPGLAGGGAAIVQRSIGSKEYRRACADEPGQPVRVVAVPLAERALPALGPAEVLALARWASTVEARLLGDRPLLLELEWARDGDSGELFLLEARPVALPPAPSAVLELERLTEHGELVVSGQGIGVQIRSGRVRRVLGGADLHGVEADEVLVSEVTHPEWEAQLTGAAAVITERGGRGSHAAEAGRRLGIPVVVGAEQALRLLRDGETVTVSCAEGEEGRVYRGRLGSTPERIDVGGLPRPRTPIRLNLSEPGEALALARLPSEGIGQARLEQIIRTHVRMHPLAAVHPARLPDEARATVERIADGYADATDAFVSRLAEGVATLAAAFWPREVMVRLSDLRVDEAAELPGGSTFETPERNPDLGLRGAARYTDPRYRDGFALECLALRRARQELGLRNIKLVVPFCRSLLDAERALEELARHGLGRGEDGLEIHLSCDVPGNVVMAAEFAVLFDGLSVECDDLVQLLLGVDAASGRAGHLFNPRDPAVRRVVTQLIRAAHDAGRPIALTGRVPGENPELVRFLVDAGIDSISVDPADLLRATLNLAQCDQARAPGRRATDRDRLLAEFLSGE